MNLKRTAYLIDEYLPSVNKVQEAFEDLWRDRVQSDTLLLPFYRQLRTEHGLKVR